MIKIKSIASNKNSFYKTEHIFERYGEIQSIEEFQEYCQWAKSNNVNVYILGNGSNTLFTRKKVGTLVLKNKIEKYIKPLDKYKVEVSSSVLVSDLLKYCYDNSLSSFYYLASVPATIGGALAMNAGRGREHEMTIYDFVEKVTFFEDGCLKTLKKEEVERSYRETIFTGIHKRFIVCAVFQFNVNKFESDPIAERREWSKKYQDNSSPNCGSVFKLAHPSILHKLKGLCIGGACFSSKTYNWILNKSDNAFYIVLVIKIAYWIHFLKRKKVSLEIIEVK